MQKTSNPKQLPTESGWPIPATLAKNHGRGIELRVIYHFAMAGYCTAIYLALDFAYSGLLHDEGRSPRIPDAAYHHTLAPNFDGYDNWGDTRFKVYTNSLGFRDAAVREVPAISPVRRVILMGDSFTEGLGVNFEDSFAGMLYAAGSIKIEKWNGTQWK